MQKMDGNKSKECENVNHLRLSGSLHQELEETQSELLKMSGTCDECESRVSFSPQEMEQLEELCLCGEGKRCVKFEATRRMGRSFKSYLKSREDFLKHILIVMVILFIQLMWQSPVAAEKMLAIQGSSQRCLYEGEVFPLPGYIQSPCYTCICRRGHVECERQHCPTLKGCFLILAGHKEGCCEVCKGCTHNNVTYSSGTEVVENCMQTSCIAGVLTRSEVQCYVPCKHPLPPKAGQCCPTCNSCSLNGRIYQNGEEATLPGDPCVRCTCKDGTIECAKRSCPVLACPPTATYIEKGDCCPKCNGTRTRYLPRGYCLLGNKVYRDKTTFRLDACTNCTCDGTTSVCDRVVCPPLDCDRIHQVSVPGSCCFKCEEPVYNSHCSWNNQAYQDGQRWDVNNCRSCICDAGTIRCTEQMCPPDLKCQLGYKAQLLPGKCCPECVGENGVCTVFGDPHYRSFDGQIFNFQGACKYLLAADCVGKTFSIRVKNDARESRSFSWTRTVTLRVAGLRVTLGQRKRIKVNGKRVSLPFSHKAMNIYKEGYSAMVETSFGLKLLWDGYSFLEVTAPHSLNRKLCGLCGNFNGNRTDDFMTRKNELVSHPSVFGNSWRVGGKKACSRTEQGMRKGPVCTRGWRVREKADKVCNVIQSDAFATCHNAVPFYRYLKSCKFDMCGCPFGRKCYCEVLTAYARACERAGVKISDWRKASNCYHKRNWSKRRRRRRRRSRRRHSSTS